MKPNTIELTLCYRCASVYYDMPDRLIKRADYKQCIKGDCDICKRGKGFDFVISNIKRREFNMEGD